MSAFVATASLKSEPLVPVYRAGPELGTERVDPAKPCFRTEASHSCREQCARRAECCRIIAEWLRYR